MRSFALELAPHMIRVNTVDPTVVYTDMVTSQEEPRQSSKHGPEVDRQGHAGDIVGLARGQEKHGVSDVDGFDPWYRHGRYAGMRDADWAGIELGTNVRLA